MFRTILPPYLFATSIAAVYGTYSEALLVSLVIGLVIAAPLTLIYGTFVRPSAAKHEVSG